LVERASQIYNVCLHFSYARKPIRLDDLNWERDAAKFLTWQGYAQSKLANILFCKELAKRLAQDNTGAKVNHLSMLWSYRLQAVV
jgi:NAD(P)-dependent dehydrogenase (short-subunit alcohol dehydrogenase family)